MRVSAQAFGPSMVTDCNDHSDSTVSLPHREPTYHGSKVTKEKT